MDNPTPIVSPIMALLKSRKALIALFGLVFDVIIVLMPPDIAPRLAANREPLLTAVTGLAALLISVIAGEDMVTKHADGKVEAAKQMASAVAANAPVPPITSPENGSQSRPYNAPGFTQPPYNPN